MLRTRIIFALIVGLLAGVATAAALSASRSDSPTVAISSILECYTAIECSAAGDRIRREHLIMQSELDGVELLLNAAAEAAESAGRAGLPGGLAIEPEPAPESAGAFEISLFEMIAYEALRNEQHAARSAVRSACPAALQASAPIPGGPSSVGVGCPSTTGAVSPPLALTGLVPVRGLIGRPRPGHSRVQRLTPAIAFVQFAYHALRQGYQGGARLIHQPDLLAPTLRADTRIRPRIYRRPAPASPAAIPFLFTSFYQSFHPKAFAFEIPLLPHIGDVG